eukprot:CAMPEP_0197257066 /NCGR_PEP_ID=MMETSP1429-20130617/77558_1 /TAXON_ID=49237 /ORGANISM="Chaetoceros  sp., Strain UNC1202" /LENGTH=42 /DNA_ID= /DNA_START= /DNA_END= /DNA_ORIENTATION=
MAYDDRVFQVQRGIVECGDRMYASNAMWIQQIACLSSRVRFK